MKCQSSNMGDDVELGLNKFKRKANQVAIPDDVAERITAIIWEAIFTDQHYVLD